PTALVDTPSTLAMFRRRTLLVPLVPLALAACSEQRPAPTAVTPPPAPTVASATAAPGASAASASVPDAGPYEGPWIGATVMQAPIYSEMEFPSDKLVKE